MTKKLTIALAGNPNSGKTTVFNEITGARQQIANYPGVTVEKKVGKVVHKGHEIEVVDLPGTYSLTAYSLEEIVARDFLINERPDLVVDIVDASNLDRNLYLTIQFKELGIPLIVALNMVDMAESRGIIIDHRMLSELLGVPVVPMVARSSKGVVDLLDTLIESAQQEIGWNTLNLSYGMDIDHSLGEMEDIINKSKVFDAKYPARWRALKCLEGDNPMIALLNRDPALGSKIEDICNKTEKHTRDTLDEDPEAIIADYRYGYITGITKRVIKRKIEARLNLSDKIDKVATNRIAGPLIMMGILYAVYEFTFSASEIPIEWFGAFFNQLAFFVSGIIPPGMLQSLIVSGVIDGVGGVLGFVPLIMFMFFTIAIMEDSGYMARVAYMLDRVLRWFGLHGNSVMALIVSGGISGGCAVPGVMATRTLRDPKERIATLLAVPFMNCGAKLPVYAVLIGAFFSQNKARMLFLLTLLSWGFALFAAKIIRSTILKGPKTPFVMELPPYRLPTLKGLWIHTWERTWQYIKKAGTVILGFSIVLWAMMTFPGLSEDQASRLDNERDQITAQFLQKPSITDIIRDENDLSELDMTYDSIKGSMGLPDKIPQESKGSLISLAQAAYLIDTQDNKSGKIETTRLKSASDYLSYRKQIRELGYRRQQETLKGTFAGWLGIRLEAITKPLGFDYRTNIALVGGFAAKEVVVSTLGTAYSLGETGAEETKSLSDRLRNSSDWNPLTAFTMLIFTMLYVPCFVTVISIKKESSWGWAGFSIGFNLCAAYLVALIIRQTGLVLGLGV